MQKTLIEVKNLKKYFPAAPGFLIKSSKFMVHAVDDISFDINEGETLGIAGESGCGKSTLGKTCIALYKPTEGKVYFEKRNIFELKKKQIQKIRPKMQLIFQDPYASLNPRLTVRTIVGEALSFHNLAEKEQITDLISKTLEKVGLDPEHMNRYPHEFSGGQRQRIAIARALILNPQFVVADEPTSALDVSIQASILNLMKDLQKEQKLTYLFISHDLSTVRFISNRVGIMYMGKLVELGPTDDLFINPQHPYTKALLEAIPVPNPEIEIKQTALKGDVPTPVNPPPGCRFYSRCQEAKPDCRKADPKLIEIRKNHYVACFKATNT
jgi:oligopeptide/dipeptide ABC transporter ATP-binding protein